MVDERGRLALVTFEDMRRICEDRQQVTELKVKQIQEDVARLRDGFRELDDKLDQIAKDVAAIAAVYKG